MKCFYIFGYSLFGWDHVTQGLVQLGFTLMDAFGPKSFGMFCGIFLFQTLVGFSNKPIFTMMVLRQIVMSYSLCKCCQLSVACSKVQQQQQICLFLKKIK